MKTFYKTLSGFLIISLFSINIAHTQNQSMTTTQNLLEATFGGGCFWCTEAIFAELKGVESVASGYAGGHVKNPTYEEVCTGSTGHAEVIRIIYDPKLVSYEKLLEVFFNTHNPTTLNRQGADRGTQYRSVVFYHDEKQKEEAEAMITALDKAKVFDDPIVTEVSPISNYYPAENYHQDYFANNPNNSYCNFVIKPKLAKFMKQYKADLKK